MMIQVQKDGEVLSVENAKDPDASITREIRTSRPHHRAVTTRLHTAVGWDAWRLGMDQLCQCSRGVGTLEVMVVRFNQTL